jgi:hypothetical protein
VATPLTPSSVVAAPAYRNAGGQGWVSSASGVDIMDRLQCAYGMDLRWDLQHHDHVTSYICLQEVSCHSHSLCHSSCLSLTCCLLWFMRHSATPHQHGRPLLDLHLVLSCQCSALNLMLTTSSRLKGSTHPTCSQCTGTRRGPRHNQAYTETTHDQQQHASMQ